MTSRSRRRTGHALLFVALGCLLGGGCSPSSATVTGTVRYKGDVIRTGEVSFVGEDGTARSGAISQDGVYEIKDVPIGAVSVGVVAKTLVTEKTARPGSPDGASDAVPPAKVTEQSLV